MNRLPLILIFLLAITPGVAQESNFLHNRTVMERIPNLSTGNVVALGNMSVSSPGVVGDVYLNPDYRAASFWLYEEGKIAHGFAAKLDLQRMEFDIRLPSGIRAMAGNNVRTFVWADSLTKARQYFVNAKEYGDEEGTKYFGFFQILSEGNISLFKLTRVSFKAADRNPTHSTGSPDHRFIKHHEFYYAVGTTALELPKRKGIMKLFESKKEAMEKFIEVNEIDFSKEWHLTMLFDHYNGLVK